jgi:hypothetical protein
MRQISQVVILFVVAFIIADFLSHGSVTTTLAKVFAGLANSWAALASGQNVQPING